MKQMYISTLQMLRVSRSFTGEKMDQWQRQTDQRLDRLEANLSELLKSTAVETVQFQHLDNRLEKIENTLRWVVRLIIGALIAALITAMLSGSLVG